MAFEHDDGDDCATRLTSCSVLERAQFRTWGSQTRLCHLICYRSRPLSPVYLQNCSRRLYTLNFLVGFYH